MNAKLFGNTLAISTAEINLQYISTALNYLFPAQTLLFLTFTPTHISLSPLLSRTSLPSFFISLPLFLSVYSSTEPSRPPPLRPPLFPRRTLSVSPSSTDPSTTAITTTSSSSPFITSVLSSSQQISPKPSLPLCKVSPISDGDTVDFDHFSSPRDEGAQRFIPKLPPAFGSSPNLEALALEANKSQVQDGDSVVSHVQYSRPMHEITFSTDDKPKLLSQCLHHTITE
ncbi:uncharacterized protein LOC114278150 [Camellia sinensis]|uniref:uncharacterized protein LOC114278150 n=1 Tax=Camellia sinensis TaxID=4442 RepID=UPI001036C201|nr:uncharacterized protein LOC114278150 [Camellia sinensis]